MIHSNCGAVKVSHCFLPAVDISSAFTLTGCNILPKKSSRKQLVKKPKTVQNIDFSQIIIVMIQTPRKLSVPSSVRLPPPALFVSSVSCLVAPAHYFMFLLTMMFCMWRKSKRGVCSLKAISVYTFLGLPSTCFVFEKTNIGIAHRLRPLWVLSSRGRCSCLLGLFVPGNIGTLPVLPGIFTEFDLSFPQESPHWI